MPESTTAEQVGTRTAFSHVWSVRGSPRQKKKIMRLLTLTVLVLMPGGLLVLAVYMLARTISTQMRLEQGTGRRRFARALSVISLRDVWSHTRQSFSLVSLKAS